jgi:hypothetical protein
MLARLSKLTAGMFAATLVQACSTTAASPPLEPVIEIQKEEVAVRVPCQVDAVPVAQYPFDAATKDAPIDKKVELLTADRLARAETERVLRAALDGCRK